MQWVDDHNLRYLQFPHLLQLQGLWHGIFTRHMRNGLQGERLSFNVGLNTGDPDRLVIENRSKMITAAGSRQAVYAHQVHGTTVAVWDQRQDKKDVRLDGDALVTNRPGAALVIQTADCQSILMADPVRRVVANVHSGWRGSIGNIIGRTVKSMTSKFGCRPADIIAGIGPSLGPCCAEFKNFRREIPSDFWPYRRGGDLFDFWQVSIDQLTAAGVPRGQVATADICTRCNLPTFFSYRGEGGTTGRFAAVIRW